MAKANKRMKDPLVTETTPPPPPHTHTKKGVEGKGE